MKITEHDAITGETIEREATEEELAQAEADLEAAQLLAADLETKAAARAALLKRLDITEEEARLLIG